jgi:hypothetical protein
MVIYKWRESGEFTDVTDQDYVELRRRECADLSALAEMMAFGGNRPRKGDLRKISQQFPQPRAGSGLGTLGAHRLLREPVKVEPLP